MIRLSLSCKESRPHSLSKNVLPPAIILRMSMSSNLMKALLPELLQLPLKSSSRLFAWKHSQKFYLKPQHTSNPLQAPPARIFSSSPPPCWLAGWQRGGGTSILVPFNPLPTSCTAFCPHAHLPSHSFYSSKLAPESSQYLLFPSPFIAMEIRKTESQYKCK